MRDGSYLHSSLGTAGFSFFLIFFVDLWGLTLNLTSTGKGTVNFTSQQSWDKLDSGFFCQTEFGTLEAILNDFSVANSVYVFWNKIQNLTSIFSLNDGILK